MSATPSTSSLDFGYDPTVDEPIDVSPPPAVAPVLPAAAFVELAFLPPVGHQHTPNCAAWASTYGLATWTAAQAAGTPPSDPSLQASSAYIYIGVLQGNGVASGSCTGSKLTSYFQILAGGGTPSMAQAPYEPQCGTLWSDYGGQDLPADAAFTIAGVKAVSAKTPDEVKQILFSGLPLVYGTSLYTDFPDYDGSPVPYVGNGTILMKPGTTQPVGHCMLIVGYDDTVGAGAFLIQNSFGTGWGSDGFVWMAYDSFTALAQGKALYVSA